MQSGSTREDTLRDALLSNHATFRGLEDHCALLHANGDDEGAAWIAQLAAHFAWFNHTGLFTSAKLDTVLDSIAARIPRLPTRRRAPGAIERVLHVLSVAYEVGGHTRLAQRWATSDNQREHTFVLTMQDAQHAPAMLSGQRVQHLTAASLRGRAEELRHLAATHDAVVLHTHPFDVMPVLAFRQWPDRPPVALLNHADHVFWLGGSVADIVANLRPSAVELAVQRRGIEAQRCALLPIPLTPRPRSKSRTEAKRALGLDEDTVVLLTIASPYKFVASESPTFLELVTPIVASNEELVLLAVGPTADGDWAAAAATTGGRICPLGACADLQPFHEAADLYLDSYPFASMTSLLETAMLDVPALCYQPEPADIGPLATDDLGSDNYLHKAATSAEYRATLEGLISDGAARERAGQQTAVGVQVTHLSPGWEQYAEQLYALLGSMPTTSLASAAPERRMDRYDELLLRHLLDSAHAQGLAALLPQHPAAAEKLVVPPALLSPVLLVDGAVERTLDTLESILGTCGEHGQLDPVVIDNASTDATAEVLEALSDDVRSSRFDPPCGEAQAWSAGIELSLGEFLLLITNDIELQPGWFEPLLQQLRTDPETIAVTPTVTNGERIGVSAPPTTAQGVCLVVRASALRAGQHVRAIHVAESAVSRV